MFEIAEANAKVDDLIGVWTQIASLHADAARLAAEIGDTMPGEDDWAREEISLALHITPYAADQLLEVGRAMRSRFVDFGKALAAGEITYPHLQRLLEETKYLDDDTARLVEAKMLPVAKEEAPRRFTSLLRKAVIDIDPRGAQERVEQATADRDISLYPQPDGQATLAATGPAEDLHQLFTELDARAVKTGPDDERPIGARRYDAFMNLMRNGWEGTPSPEHHGRKVNLNITMTFAQALAFANGSAELDGYGPITAQAARILARDAKWRAFIVDATTGALIGLGNEGYEPNQRVQDFIAARDRTCRIPHCNQPAWRCHNDHAIPHSQGGATDNENLGPHDTRHHRLKHQAGWSVAQDPDGTRHWTTALGRTYDKRPPAYPVDGADPPPF